MSAETESTEPKSVDPEVLRRLVWEREITGLLVRVASALEKLVIVLDPTILIDDRRKLLHPERINEHW